MARLSVPARQALALAVTHGELERHASARDGWWTYPGCPWIRPWGVNYHRPGTVLSPTTLRALVRSGHLSAPGADSLRPTASGIAALARMAGLDRAAEGARPVSFAATARVFLADGTVLHAGQLHDPERFDEGGCGIDPVLYGSPGAAARQTVGERHARVAAGPGGTCARPVPASEADLDVHAGDASCIAPLEDMEFGVAEVADGPEWWGVLVHRGLGLVFLGEASLVTAWRPNRGLFRGMDGGGAVTGPAWDALPFPAWGRALDLPESLTDRLATAGRMDPTPAMLKALTLAEGDGLVRLGDGYWTGPRCPVREVARRDGSRAAVPVSYVDAGTVAACARRGLLAGGPGMDARAALTESGREALEAAAPADGLTGP